LNLSLVRALRDAGDTAGLKMLTSMELLRAGLAWHFKGAQL